ncbi:MAG: hypothetical protein ACR2OR_12840 [Hyphomicrobiales bacterium]
MKTTTLFLLLAASITSFFFTLSAGVADRGGPICTYERRQAMAAGRAGNKKLADKLWLEYRNCTRGR